MNDLPNNIEAEQALLGAILFNNDVLHKCNGLSEGHFYDPVHARIFTAAKALIDAGKIASPVTLRFPLQDDDGMKELGGPAYLVRIAGASVSNFAAPDYAKTVQELAARRELFAASNEAAERAISSDGGAVADIRGDLEAKLAETYTAGEAQPFESFQKSMVRAIESANKAYQGGAPVGLQTGLVAVDRFLGSIRAGEVYTLAGRPSMGKTTIAHNILNRMGAGGIFASKEMTSEALAIRTVSQKLRETGIGIPYLNIMNGWTSETEFRQVLEATQTLQENKTIIIKPGSNELSKLVSDIRAAAREVRKTHPLKLIVVDFLQLLRVKGLSKFDALGEILGVFKALALEYNVPIIMLSQLNRAVETRDNKRPTLGDLRGSGEIEELSDNVIFCYRHAYYLKRDIENMTDVEEKADAMVELENIKNDLELIVAKHKNGKIGTIRLGCEIQFNHLYDVETQDDMAF